MTAHKKKAVAANTNEFTHLLKKVHAKFDIPPKVSVKLVFEEDGTEFDDDTYEYYIATGQAMPTLVLLSDGEKWEKNVFDPNSFTTSLSASATEKTASGQSEDPGTPLNTRTPDKTVRPTVDEHKDPGRPLNTSTPEKNVRPTVDEHSPTPQKHIRFVSALMGDKRVTEIHGVGRDLGSKLKDQGYGQAYHVFGQYLVLNKDYQRFIEWMKKTCGATTRQANDCYICLNQWSNIHF